MDTVYVEELVNGLLRDETRGAVERVIAAMRDREGIDAVVVAGTELSLLIGGSSSAGVPLLHTSQIHIRSAVDWLLQGADSGPSDDIGTR